MGEAGRLCGNHHKVPNLIKSLGFFNVSGENDPLRFKPHPSNMMSKVGGALILIFLRNLSLNEPHGDSGSSGILLLLLIPTSCFRMLSMRFPLLPFASISAFLGFVLFSVACLTNSS